ncbi:prolyl oligopeptidase family serine peptidase [Candidatus Tisiphia endosymbiont of Mystacides longicornis]|uniref:S9 family peptidase n=1 Tax=Candidatus Tisiphia endosymbiont of Mystacides longicornis TaxID=3139330 RepID=UPI003CCAFDDA
MNKPVKTYDASMFYLNTSLRGISFSYDGESILYSSDETGCFNIYRVFVSNGKTEQLTQNLTQCTIGISYFPSDNRFLFSQDWKGNELFHLWVCEENCMIKDITPGINLKAKFLQWSNDGRHFWVLHNQRNPKFFDVYCYRSKDYQSELVFKNQEALTICTISRNGRWIACEKEHDSHSNSLFLYDLSKEEKPGANALRRICISGLQNIARFRVLCFSPDSKKFFYTSNQDSEFEDAWFFDMETGKSEKVIQVGWDVSTLYFSPSGRYRISEINQNSTTLTSIQDISTTKDVSLPKLSGAISQVHFSKDECYIAFYLESCVSPPQLHLVNLEDKGHLQLTTLSNSNLSKNDLVTADVISYPSFDGLEIPSLLYRPWGTSSNNRVPAMIWVHGGPGDQSRQTFDPLIQHLVNHGYAILAVNHRGSSGYGKTFFHLADRKHGDLDVKDCIYGRKYLETLDWIDASHIGIMGSSYGGYIAVASLTFEPDAFDVAINIFGVMNWIRTLNSIPPWMTSTRRRIFGVMGDPSADTKRLKAISPYFHAANIRKPLLVVQGKNDPRVLKVESDDIVRDVRNNGVVVEYLMFEDEGHGFSRRENLITVANTCLSFLNQNLKKELN